MKYKSIGDMFYSQARVHAKRPLFWVRDKKQYNPITWHEAQEDVTAFASALLGLGLKKGDRLGLLSENRYEWAVTDLACLSIGVIDVPIYSTNIAEQCGYIFRHCGTNIVVLSTQAQLDKILGIQGIEKDIHTLIVFNKGLVKVKEARGIKILQFADLIEQGKKKNGAKLIEQKLATIDSDDIATLIYTSGTTANPKGVCLTHRNFLSNVESSAKSIVIDESFRCLSFLPLSHVFERMAGFYMFLFQGAEIAYAESMETIAKNMAEIKPTVILGVPRFYEKLYGRIKAGLAKAPKLKQFLIQLASDTKSSCNTYTYEGKRPPLLLKATDAIFEAVVLKKLKAKLGGRLKFFVSGGAPLSPEINEGFSKFGLTIIQGYGLTETSPVIAANKLEANRPASVGPIIEGIEVKIASDGEILTRGPHVMKGYYKDPEETAKTIDKDLWLHTGDIGYLDDDNFLYITDRKKDIIVTSGGKNVAPAKIENMLKNTPLIETAVIIGDERKFISALIVPDKVALEEFAKSENINEYLPNLLDHPLVQKAIHTCVQDVNAQLSSYEKVKKYRVVSDEFSIETGDLTPTMKVKKHLVFKKYRDLIESMYQG